MTYPQQLQRLLSGLNEEQLAAVNVGPGLAALAGAPGSGKTRSVIGRLARLVYDGLPGQYILATTFTRTAAWEMNTRLEDLGVTGCRVGTIHSVANQILNTEWPTYAGKLISDYRLQQLIDGTIVKLKRAGVLRSTLTYDNKTTLAFIEECKATGICYLAGDPFGLNDMAFARQMKVATAFAEEMNCAEASLMQIYVELEESRHRGAGMSYDDMQLWSWMMLLAREDLRQKWRHTWSTIVIDEAMDCSLIQWDFAQILAGLPSIAPEAEKIEGAPVDDKQPHNLMVAGDVSQSMYSWRHAVPELFMEFAMRQDVLLCPLPINYRSVPGICNLGQKLVEKYDWHLVGTIKPHRAPLEQMPYSIITEYPSLIEESRGILAMVQQRRLEDCAVLCRLSAFLHLVEIECIRARIPYVKRAGGGFTDSQEAKDLLSYLRVANGSDVDTHISRMINAPYRYIGFGTIKAALAEEGPGHDRGVRVVRRLRRGPKLGQKQRRALLDLEECLQELRDKDRPARRELEIVLDATGYGKLRRRGDAPDESSSAVIDALLCLAEQHQTSSDFIIYMDRLAASIAQGQRQLRRKDQEGAGRNCLTLSTIHRAKGLQWPTVFVADVAAGRFPCSWSNNYDEEVRLFYVAVTRAANEVVITHSRSKGLSRGNSSSEISQFVLMARAITSEFIPSSSS